MSSHAIATKPEIAGVIQQLAATASLEMSVHDADELKASAGLLAPHTRMYVSHLPGQAWRDTVQTCTLVSDAGLYAIPHVPVRRIENRKSFEEFLSACVAQAKVREVLLIAGDSARAAGPFVSTMSALESGALTECGIRAVSVAGHPEGHPTISEAELRRAEQKKIEYAFRHGLRLTFLTQFFFEAAPFLLWRQRLRCIGPDTHIVAGLAGPAKLATLVKFAMKCGVGPSLRALKRNATVMQLLSDRGPERLVRDIAADDVDRTGGIHLFSFGGLMRTCEWLSSVRAGRFDLDDNDGFRVRA